MKSGIVTESRDSVKSRSLGAIASQDRALKKTAKGTSRSQATPKVYALPEKPRKLFVLEYVAKKEIPMAMPPNERPPM